MTDANTDSEQPLISHLIELRRCVLRVVTCIFVVLLALLPFANEIYSFIATPLIAKLPEGSSMIATEVISPFFAPFKLTLFCAIFITVPYSLFQAWSFITPGLYTKEKKLIIPLLISSTLLFYTGILFAYYIVFPVLFAFIAATAPTGVQIMTDINHYLDFILKLFFAFGVSFEIPIATFLLIRSGFVSADKLGKNRPYIILSAFFIGMLLTPPDVISQILLAVPMWLLFESGLILGKIYGGKKDTSDEKEDKEDNETI
ncbi:MAG TPA: twin-arginine translocase subunit TatC [Thiotrichaceae bacterium]|jgi:sec-independent protein translocase protein TatC|nr:twin-arginine translocase subunit TatC [Thiotrichaceae bacterium]HIM07609.1 twin-arginine translocase subunit TatC [Gammaproteobacteria bacterium]